MRLQTLPGDTKIVIRGYENGYNDILKLNNLNPNFIRIQNQLKIGSTKCRNLSRLYK